MARDPLSETTEDKAPPPETIRAGSVSTRAVLMAGVAGACVLGVGLGLWARPAVSERRMAARPAATASAAPQPPHQIQIVVNDTAVPGAPLEVMPQPAVMRPPASQAASAAASPLVAAPVSPGFAPTRPPAGLVRIQAVAPPQITAIPQPVIAPVAVKAAAPLKVAALQVPKPVQIQKVAAPKPDLRLAQRKRQEQQQLAEAAQRRAKADHEIKLAQLRKDELRKLEGRKEEARLDAVREAQARESQARANQARRELARKEEARETVRLAQARKAQARQAQILEAKAERRDAERREALHRTELAQAKADATRRARAVALARYEATRRAAAQRNAGRLQLASTRRCISPDPGAAMVCGDPQLGAADRRMTRALQQAQAAGVSPSELDRQQRRWLAARASAAREAPWAVHDVYLSRIAELQSQAHEAHDGGY